MSLGLPWGFAPAFVVQVLLGPVNAGPWGPPQPGPPAPRPGAHKQWGRLNEVRASPKSGHLLPVILLPLGGQRGRQRGAGWCLVRGFWPLSNLSI